MAKVQHKDLPENQLHEPKGASLAPANSFLFANGDGTTGFRPIQNSDLAGLVTVSLDLQPVVDTTDTYRHPDATILDYGYQEPIGGLVVNEWGLLVQRESFRYDPIYVEPNSPYKGSTVVALMAGWYFIELTVGVVRSSGTSAQRAAVRVTYSTANTKSTSLASVVLNDSHNKVLHISDKVYLEEGDSFSIEAYKTASGVSFNAAYPTQLPVLVGTLEPQTYLAPVIKPSGLKVWRVGQ